MKNEIVSSNISGVPVRVSLTQRDNSDGARLSPPHYHDEIEILTVTGGALKILFSGGEDIIREGEIGFISSRLVHETFALGDMHRSAFIQFKRVDYLDGGGKNLANFMSLGATAFYKFKASEADGVRRIVDTVLDEHTTRREAYDISIRGHIYCLIAELIRCELIKSIDTGIAAAVDERLIPVIAYIDSSYGEKITLEELGHIANLNCDYLSRQFKRATGSTIGDYINFVRLCKAEKLLSTTDESISQIAMATGFSSLSYFNRVFKKYKKCSPSAYKKIKFTRE